MSPLSSYAFFLNSWGGAGVEMLPGQTIWIGAFLNHFSDRKGNEYDRSNYSRASHSADFGDKKNQCISKTVYCKLSYMDIKKSCICEISALTL